MEDQVDIQKNIQAIVKQKLEQLISTSDDQFSRINIKELAFSYQICCYLTLTKMATPYKTQDCKHPWCIEGEYFKELSECPCGMAITQDNIIIDQNMQQLLNVIEILNEQYFQNDSNNKYDECIMIYKRSQLIFPCVDGETIPLPLPFLITHISSPSQIKLSYNFNFNTNDLIDLTYNTIIRVCDTFCLYDLNNIRINNQFSKCIFCSNNISVMNLQIDYYLMKVRQLLQNLRKLQSSQFKVEQGGVQIQMQYGKFKFNKILYTPENIDQKLSLLITS